MTAGRSSRAVCHVHCMPTRVLVPGRCRADLDRLAAEFGVPFERGPDELKDLPAYFGKGGRGPISRGTTCAYSPKSSMRRP